jgi:signal transduction histidine kinase
VTAAAETIRARARVRSQYAVDALVAAVAFGLTLALLAAAHGASRGLDVAGGLLAAVASFPLLARRSRPLAVFALTTAASATLNGLGYAIGPPFGPTIALFFVAYDERTRGAIARTSAVVGLLFAAHVAATAVAQETVPTTPLLFGVLVWGTAWVAGDQLRQRRRRLADLVERAERAERETQRERRLAAAEERTRIARDLHDSAAHSINVILVQAGAARLLQERDPDAARQALTTIEDVARETVGEIDRLVGALRDEGRGGEVEPPAGLAALDTLLERQRVAGLETTVEVEGRRRQLAPALDQAAYRILQESLTNAARHGSGAATVRIAYERDGLELTVSNPAGPAPGAGSGHGILGMRERAALLGGGLEVGREAGRFVVRASLPYSAAEAR